MVSSGEAMKASRNQGTNMAKGQSHWPSCAKNQPFSNSIAEVLRKNDKGTKAKAEIFAREHDGEQIKEMITKGLIDFKNVL